MRTENFFNETVKILAKRGMFPKHISVIIDPTDIRTTRKYSDCGTVTRKKRVRDKGGKWKEIEITVWGWKLIVIFYGPKKIRRGYGKASYTENLQTTVVGIKGLTTYGRNNRVVYLTNMKVHKPLKVFDEYDERSVIENSLFKEAKTGWHIKHSPQKTEQAMLIHTFFTLTIFALTNAYREWAREQDEEELIDTDIPSLGIRRWRQEIKRKGKNKAVVFIEDTYPKG